MRFDIRSGVLLQLWSRVRIKLLCQHIFCLFVGVARRRQLNRHSSPTATCKLKAQTIPCGAFWEHSKSVLFPVFCFFLREKYFSSPLSLSGVIHTQTHTHTHTKQSLGVYLTGTKCDTVDCPHSISAVTDNNRYNHWLWCCSSAIVKFVSAVILLPPCLIDFVFEKIKETKLQGIFHELWLTELSPAPWPLQ